MLGWTLIFATALVIVTSYAFAIPPVVTVYEGPSGETFMENFTYTPWGRPYTNYLAAALFLVGITLCSYSAGWGRPWLACAVGIPLGWALWILTTISVIAFIRSLGIDPDKWGWGFTFSGMFSEGMVAGGILLGGSAIVAAVITTQLIRLGVHVLARKPITVREPEDVHGR